MSAAGTAVETLALARELIAAPSPNPPGDETAVAAVLREALPAAGLPAPEVLARDERRPNLQSTIEFGPGGRHLVLCGHIDTKPVGDAEWSVEPLAGTVDGDRLYGLGAADMKGAVAASVAAAARLAATPPPAGRLTLLFCADEENGAAFGARHVAAAGLPAADGAVIGEPGGIEADFDRLHLGSRGIARALVVARAAQGHSSLAGELRMRNAGVDAARAVAALAEAELSAPANPGALAAWEVDVNPGLDYSGGVGYGVMPGRIAARLEVRLLPGMERQTVAAELEARLAGAAPGADLALEWDEPPADWLDGALVAVDDPLVVAARGAYRQTLGTDPAPSLFPGTTDSTFLAAAGLPTLPACGPGLLRRTHAADEWVSVTALHQSVDLFEAIAREFCGGGGASPSPGPGPAARGRPLSGYPGQKTTTGGATGQRTTTGGAG